MSGSADAACLAGSASSDIKTTVVRRNCRREHTDQIDVGESHGGQSFSNPSICIGLHKLQISGPASTNFVRLTGFKNQRVPSFASNLLENRVRGGFSVVPDPVMVYRQAKYNLRMGQCCNAVEIYLHLKECYIFDVVKLSQSPRHHDLVAVGIETQAYPPRLGQSKREIALVAADIDYRRLHQFGQRCLDSPIAFVRSARVAAAIGLAKRVWMIAVREPKATLHCEAGS